ncbi:peptidoglycan-binding domain-containing protein [Mesorhizobium sp. BAC0120]|uniref:peptidoglycan-binding domain-containing protein n=1 Tax=Mesorhizobium sp. BAC0120 TaxID=3090670 RepID=UPI00298D5F95|nr:peptidoglycan-binding domain-containing protein [Mesorhizobium sp. BAC0120]MDW6024478.1 peptidoglycan-binding domain-containing protein [Mesorhizobium sp. BAC0120]
MAFESPTLQGSPRLDRAAAGGGSVKLGPPHDDPEAVRRIQRGLNKLGYQMPRSFPKGDGQEPDGVYGEETRQTVLDFQKRKFPSDPSQWDGRTGPNTLREMDRMLAKGEKVLPGPAPLPVPPVPNGACTPKDDTIPTGPPYDGIPADTMRMLQRSYRERDGRNMNLVEGFPEDRYAPCPQAKVTFREVLDTLMKRNGWSVLDEMRSRCELMVPGLWGKIRWLHDVYDFGSSRGIWCCVDPDQILLLRNQLKVSPNFCSDMIVGHSTHQKHMRTGEPVPSQCYRELNKVGQAGLHLCTMVGSAKGSIFGEWQNFHIDPHQIGAAKGKKCACWYAKTKHHFGDVGRWCVGWFLNNYGQRTEVKAALYVLDVDPKNEEQAYQKLMQVVGDYDTLVDMADHPGQYSRPWDPKRTAVLALARLYKELYLAFMAPQYDP